MTTIDLNADLGEQVGDDDALLEIVTSANLAAGFHAGTPATMRHVCRVAVKRGVRIGAQVSYRDREGFGRRVIDVHPDELTADVIYQLGALDAVARSCGTRVSYVRPHGALYNVVVRHELQAAAVVAAVRAYDERLPLLALSGSRVLEVADAAGLTGVPEAFADRAYTAAGALVPRDRASAVLVDPGLVEEQTLRIARSGEVVAIDGTVVAVNVRSICLHGDTPDAVSLARRVRSALTQAGIALAPFV